jgi:hypothetical protein
VTRINHWNSQTTKPFWKAFAALPDDIKAQAREAYRFFQANPSHPGLRFKALEMKLPVYSVRITQGYRALAIRDGNTLGWFWIGGHAEYNKIVKALRSQ